MQEVGLTVQLGGYRSYQPLSWSTNSVSPLFKLPFVFDARRGEGEQEELKAHKDSTHVAENYAHAKRVCFKAVWNSLFVFLFLLKNIFRVFTPAKKKKRKWRNVSMSFGMSSHYICGLVCRKFFSFLCHWQSSQQLPFYNYYTHLL